jgi:two-component system invasion response regulator UvrY
MNVATETVQLAVVSDNTILRNGLASVLSGLPGTAVRHVVSTVTALPAGDHDPALVVADVSRQRGARIGPSFWSLFPPGGLVVALCRPEDPPDLFAAMAGGVRAFLGRDADDTELLHAVRTVLRGGLHVSAVPLSHLMDAAGHENSRRDPRLTRREIETLRGVADGLTHGQISRRLGLTESTVNTYGRCCVERSGAVVPVRPDGQAQSIGEVFIPVPFVVSSVVGVRGVPVSAGGDRGGGALVPALQPVVPRR